MRPRARLRVVRGPLVWVLAVGEIEHFRERRDQPLGERLDLVEPARDRRLVRGARRERLAGQPATGLERDLAVLLKLAQHDRVLVRTADRRHVREVLRRGAEHRRAADVDHLDRLLVAGAVLRGDLRERVEVHADEVERPDRVLLERGNVLVVVAPREDAGVDARVERLDAAAEHLGRLGHLLDRLHLEPQPFERRRGPAARDELPAGRGEALCELLEARLVVDGDQRAQSSLTTFGSSWCSTDWTRSRSDSTVSPG